MKAIKIQKRNRIIKSFTLTSLLIFSMTSFISCDDDSDYSEEFWIGRATVIPNGDNDFTMQTDGGHNLAIVSNYAGYNPQQKNQRAFVKYTILDKNEETGIYEANLYNVENILTKNIIELTTENEEEIGCDPVHLFDVWCSGGYLNVNFGFNYGGTVTHTVNIVKNTMETYPDDGKIYLEFRHNAFNDPQNVSSLGTACFDLSPYAQEDDRVVTFVIKFNEFGSNRIQSSYEIKYDFKMDNMAPNQDDSYIGKWGYK